MTNQREPQLEDPDVLEEMADYFEEQAGVADADFRARVPEGTVLAEQELSGHTLQFTRGSTMVRVAGQSVPERTTVYDTRTGLTSQVPTAQLAYQLRKRRPDGSRIYTRRRPDVPERIPIADTCKICLANRGGKHRNFYSEWDLEQHMQLMHEREWNAMNRERDMAQRREDSQGLRSLVLALVGALNPGVAASLPSEVREQISEMQANSASVPTPKKEKKAPLSEERKAELRERLKAAREAKAKKAAD